MAWYGDLGRDARRSARAAVRGAAAASERAAAAVGCWRPEARLLGHGGVRAVARAAGVSETTVRAGVFELEDGQDPLPGRAGPAARAGAASAPRSWIRVWCRRCWRWSSRTSAVIRMSPLRWTTKSLRHLAGELTRQGHPVSAPTVGRLLRGHGLQPAGQRQDAGGRPAPGPGRPVPLYQRAGQGPPGGGRAGDQRGHEEEGAARAAADGRAGVAPEGRPGRRWRTTASSSPARTWSRRSRTGSTTSPRDTGWVNVGVDHDTSAFAVASIRRWWQARGRGDYPRRDPAADHRGRRRLQQLPLPGVEEPSWRPSPPRPGWRSRSATSRRAPRKWNKIEHRLFSHITMNWRGRPLTSHEVVVQTIAATRTRSRPARRGRPGHRRLPDRRRDQQGAHAPPCRSNAHATHGAWNYTIHPRAPPAARTAPAGEPRSRPAPPGDAGHAGRPAADRHEPPRNCEQLTAALAPPQAARAQQRYSQQRGGRARRATGKPRGQAAVRRRRPRSCSPSSTSGRSAP